jgi:RimJ/RimL family protein N-acetyltransferase
VNDAPPPPQPEAATFSRVAWPVRTSRLTIRPVTPGDLPRLHEIRSQPEVTHWLSGRTTSYDDYVQRYGTPARLASTLVYSDGDGIVGDLFLLVEAPWAQFEVREDARETQAAIGWLVDPPYAGRGYATEAARALLGICFEDLGVRRVVAGAFAANAASVRVMEKIGMRIETRTRGGSLHRDLGWQDGVEAAILRDEWAISVNA